MRIFQGDPTLEKYRTNLLRREAIFLYRIGVTPNIASFLGLASAIFAALLLEYSIVAGCFMALSLFWDGIDGVITRANGIDNKYGSIIDISCDTIGNITILTSFYFHGYIYLPILCLSILIIVLYTILSAWKSRVVVGSFRSVGTRISLGFGVLFIFGLSAINLESLQNPLGFFNFLLYCLIFLLFSTMAFDFRNILKLTHQNGGRNAVKN